MATNDDPADREKELADLVARIKPENQHELLLEQDARAADLAGQGMSEAELDQVASRQPDATSHLSAKAPAPRSTGSTRR